jgi:2,4-dienoyl-CoA reductase-like NADH-dependent reductase (Old Yellow Enzyme family)
MSKLFEPWSLKSLEFRNRVVMSPMCQYSAVDGVPGEWHLLHLGARAVGGVGLVMVEATAVTPEGRISPADTGLWNDTQRDAFRRIVTSVHAHGALCGIQLAHAGRKASTAPPWEGGGVVATDRGGWGVLGPSPLPFDEGSPVPREATAADIADVVRAFVAAARRANEAGFDVVELHFAHGYLVHEFLSPLCNRREDAYGGDDEGRRRLAVEITRAVRAAWPEQKGLFVRLSVTDWAEGGFDVGQAVALSRVLSAEGVDLVDCSSGGAVPHARVPVAPGYQVGFAAEIREACGIATGAVGLITEPEQAEQILVSGQADLVFLGRALLRHPYWVLNAAGRLGADVPYWPKQYRRARA